MAVVGLEKIFYNVSEDVDVVEVCVIVYSPIVSCPINFTFDVSLSTNNDCYLADGSADAGSAGEGSASDDSAGDEF